MSRIHTIISFQVVSEFSLGKYNKLHNSVVNFLLSVSDYLAESFTSKYLYNFFLDLYWSFLGLKSSTQRFVSSPTDGDIVASTLYRYSKTSFKTCKPVTTETFNSSKPCALSHTLKKFNPHVICSFSRSSPGKFTPNYTYVLVRKFRILST